jgi:hypothetical protein
MWHAPICLAKDFSRRKDHPIDAASSSGRTVSGKVMTLT